MPVSFAENSHLLHIYGSQRALKKHPRLSHLECFSKILKTKYLLLYIDCMGQAILSICRLLTKYLHIAGIAPQTVQGPD